MIKKKDISIGTRIVQNDPEEPTSTPYRGTVIDITETGKGPYDYYVFIILDDESMKIPEVANCCPDKIMSCFSWTIDLEEKQKVGHSLEEEEEEEEKKLPKPKPYKGPKLF